MPQGGGKKKGGKGKGGKSKGKGGGGGRGGGKKKGGGGGGNKQGQRRQGGQQRRPGGQQRRGGEEHKQAEEEFAIRGINLVPLEEYTAKGQTFPPTKMVKDLFDGADYPVNQTMPHPTEGKLRMESDERLAVENSRVWQSRIAAVREAAEVHRHVRQAAQRFARPGMKLVELCEFIENASSNLVGYDPKRPMDRGWGFPTGCSLDHCAAHYTPNPGELDPLRLKKNSLCKIDFGVQIHGHIIDCAFTMTFDPMHDTIMEAVKAATNKGVEVMGVGARLGEVGAAIQEVMESYECEYGGKTYPVKAIENLNGHSIAPWVIHGGKSVPIVKSDNQTKMEEGEMFAIETFGSTGRGIVRDDGDCSHFAKIGDASDFGSLDHKGARDLLRFINRRFGTIPFCRRWLELEGQTRHLLSLKKLVDYGVVRAYPPLCDIKGSWTAQYEHTILLKPTCKEVVSRGPDF